MAEEWHIFVADRSPWRISLRTCSGVTLRKSAAYLGVSNLSPVKTACESWLFIWRNIPKAERYPILQSIFPNRVSTVYFACGIPLVFTKDILCVQWRFLHLSQNLQIPLVPYFSWCGALLCSKIGFHPGLVCGTLPTSPETTTKQSMRVSITKYDTSAINCIM